ncbi:uncharacterized protein LOC101688436 isoform X2 [Mustela putorius furo]|nr:uncharacterized protein LOC101688436 isoform X2 [Mustela putorius furo]
MQQPIGEETLRPAGTSWREGRLRHSSEVMTERCPHWRPWAGPAWPPVRPLPSCWQLPSEPRPSSPPQSRQSLRTGLPLPASSHGYWSRIFMCRLPAATLAHGLLPARLRVLVRQVWTFFCSVANPLLPVSCVSGVSGAFPFTPSPSSEPIQLFTHPVTFHSSPWVLPFREFYLVLSETGFIILYHSSSQSCLQPCLTYYFKVIKSCRQTFCKPFRSDSVVFLGKCTNTSPPWVLLYFLLRDHRGRFFEAWTEGSSGLALTGISSPLRTLQLSRTTAMPVHGLRLLDSGVHTHKRANFLFQILGSKWRQHFTLLTSFIG